MTDTNKLAELIKQAKSKMWGKTFTCELERNMFVADHLITNDVIVLPCKVGDTVYIIYPDPRYNWGNKELKILELKVYAFHYYDNKVTVEIRGDGKYITWDISCFDVCVFFTREEAEKALEENK